MRVNTFSTYIFNNEYPVHETLFIIESLKSRTIWSPTSIIKMPLSEEDTYLCPILLIIMQYMLGVETRGGGGGGLLSL